MADETIIIKVEVDDSGTIAKLEQQKLAIVRLKEEQANLTKAYKSGQITAKEYAQESVRVEQTTKAHTRAYSELTHELQGTKSWTDQLKDSFSKNSAVADKLTGGLAGTAQGIVSMTRSAIAFIATPIGAVIAAIGAALGALTAYFRGSEEGQNRLNKIMLIGGTIMEKIMDVVELLGETIFDAFSNPQQALKDFGNFLVSQVMNRFIGMMELIPKLGTAIGLLFQGKFTEAGKVAGDAVGMVVLGVENATTVVGDLINKVVEGVDLAIEQGGKLAELQAKIDAGERALIVTRAQTELQVAKLREQAIKLEGDAKRAAINEAIQLEKQLSDAEVAHTQTKLAQAELELKANGDDKEAKLKVAEAQAAVIRADKLRYDNTLKFNKEIEKLDNEEAERKKKLAEDQARLEDNLRADKLRKEKEAIKRGADFLLQKIKDSQEAANDLAKLEEDTANAKMAAFKAATSLFGEFAGKNKTAAKAAAVANMGLTVTQILSSKAVPFIEPFASITKGIQIAAALITGRKAIKEIDQAGGGGSFLTKGPTMLMVGDNPGGVERVDVTPVSGRGQTIINSNGLIQLAGGGTVFSDGGLVTNNAVSGVNEQMMIANILRGMPAPEISIKEYTEKSNRVRIKQAITST